MDSKPKFKIAQSEIAETKDQPILTTQQKVLESSVDIYPCFSTFFHGEGEKAKELGCALVFEGDDGKTYRAMVKAAYVDKLANELSHARKQVKVQS